MRILSQNIRGASRKGFNSQVNNILFKYDEETLGLMKIEVDQSKAAAIIEKLNA